jgi:rhomboid protease GluP
MGVNLFVILALNLVFGFSSTGIDNAGHLGGLVGGFLSAGIMHFPKKKKIWLQIVFFFLALAIVSGSLFYGFSDSARVLDEKSTIMMAQEYIKQNDYEKAYSSLVDFTEKSKHPSERAYLILSFVEMKKEMFPDAKKHLNMAIKLNPKMSEAYYYLALINLDENDVKQAKVNAEKAVKIKPKEKDYLNLVSEINRYLQSTDGGV